ncbi:MAG: hypothetical protein LQ346_007422 [Caloplaca aetnensis]|nr:MAG: hypothetical protein LQ346_007422 [Caloplaca aetnensis]
MTLATNASIFAHDTTNALQDCRNSHDEQNEHQAAPKAVRPRNISKLLDLWESKGGTEDIFRASQNLLAASSCHDPSLAKEQPLRKDNAPEMAVTSPEAHVTRSNTHAPQPLNGLSTFIDVELAEKTQKRATLLRSADRNPRATAIKFAEHVEQGNGGTEPDDCPVKDPYGNLAFEDLLKYRSRSDRPPTAASGIGFQEAKNDPDRQIFSFHPTDESSQPRGIRLKGRIPAVYSSPDDVDTVSRRGRSMSRRGSSTVTPDQNVQSSPERRIISQDKHAYLTDVSKSRDTPRIRDIRQLPTPTSSNAVSARSPSPLLPGSHRTRLAHGPFYRRPTEFRFHSAGTCPASPSARGRGWEPTQSDVYVDPASEKESVVQGQPPDPLKHTGPASSSVYYSFEQSKLSSAELHHVSPTARIAETREHGYHEPTPREALSFLDAATQTGTVEQIHTASPLGWTDSESMTRGRRRHVRSGVSKPVRFERKLRRPAARTIQVIVTLTLNGATDCLADARYRI